MKRQIYGKVRDFVKAEQMFTDVCAVSAAVSGGGDSMAMLDILLRLRVRFCRRIFSSTVCLAISW